MPLISPENICLFLQILAIKHQIQRQNLRLGHKIVPSWSNSSKTSVKYLHLFVPFGLNFGSIKSIRSSNVTLFEELMKHGLI